ncbi:hypothetical protein MO973_04670 [Paenibacillus sp. TRM 82003]|nr:hypothetical protein [Paenibacillus sp. TRM 82003]
MTLLERQLHGELLLLAVAGSGLVWFVNVADMVWTLLLRGGAQASSGIGPQVPHEFPAGPGYDAAYYGPHYAPGVHDGTGGWGRGASGAERVLAVALSAVPGLGHAYLGQTHRGIALILGTIAFACGTFALAIVVGEPALLLCWIALPMLAAYAMADAASLLRRMERGESIANDPMIDPWFAPWPNGKRPIVAAALSAAPGLGHLYAGATARGMQLLGAFLLLLFLIDTTSLSMLHYALPVLWAYAFFDALRGGGAPSWFEGEAVAFSGSDRMIRWLGVALMGLGAYVLLNDVMLSALAGWFPEWPWYAWTRRWFEPLFGAAALLGFGWVLWVGRGAKVD